MTAMNAIVNEYLNWAQSVFSAFLYVYQAIKKLNIPRKAIEITKPVAF